MWQGVSRVYRGIIIGKVYRRKDHAFLGYLVQKKDGKKVILHPNSIIYAKAD